MPKLEYPNGANAKKRAEVDAHNENVRFSRVVYETRQRVEEIEKRLGIYRCPHCGGNGVSAPPPPPDDEDGIQKKSI